MQDVFLVPLSNGGFSQISTADAEAIHEITFPCGRTWRGRISDRTWRCLRRGDRGTYVEARILGKHVTLHRLLFGGRVEMIDHRDGDGLNNHRSNLRPATHSQNMRNRRKLKPSASQFKGVSRLREKWTAHVQFRVNGKKGSVCLGVFDNERDAAIAYAAARKHFGKFARVNFP